MRLDRTYSFLWKVVGEDGQILNRCGNKTQTVFAISGFIFLLLSLVGILSYRYVFNGIFKIPTFSWPLAFIWTIIIFNIYRLNLSTLSAYKPKYNVGYIFSLFIRVFFMILIGITLIKPMEAYIFNKLLSEELSKVIVVKIQNSSKESLEFFNSEIAILEEELSQIRQHVNEGRISMGNEKLNFLKEKKLKLLDEKGKTLSETQDLFKPSNMFFIGLLVFNRENPWIWFYSLSSLLIFLLPLFLKFSVSPNSRFAINKTDLQKQIILEEYGKFKLVYPKIFKISSKSQIVWEENYEDAPFNTKRKRPMINLGQENDFLKQIYGL